jgi:two-component system response regulator HydG
LAVFLHSPKAVSDKTAPRVLVVDDDRLLLRMATEELAGAGCSVIAVEDPLEALTTVKDRPVDVALVDLTLPHMSGMDLLRAIKNERPEIEVVMMTASATVETAVTAVKAGAYDYLTKPFQTLEDVSRVVSKAAERKRLMQHTLRLEEQLSAMTEMGELVGRSDKMRAVFKLVDTVAHSSSTVLLQGESGTGKELVARALHYRGPRKEQPFLALNCSALTDSLLESELFGHEKGAFTGAVSAKRGLFEAADGGTLFLDEIGDMPQSTQVRLLRVLQEGEIRRVGSNEPRKVDVRVVAATHVDLKKAMDLGRFREDLFYRLNVVNIALPPLRERADDVPVLAQHFLKVHSEKLGKQITGFTPRALEALLAHPWPGNVRELENVIEGALVLTSRQTLDVDDLPKQVREEGASRGGELETVGISFLPYAKAKQLAMRVFERRYLSALLERNGNNVSSAARAAGVDRSNFRRLLKQYEVRRPGAGGVSVEFAGDDEDTTPPPLKRLG